MTRDLTSSQPNARALHSWGVFLWFAHVAFFIPVLAFLCGGAGVMFYYGAEGNERPRAARVEKMHRTS